ncbi:MAG: SCO family protein [Alphaproteobacteria bacterium]|nr:SCO family protein [Alphaproteobacteria bacterium SS10]
MKKSSVIALALCAITLVVVSAATYLLTQPGQGTDRPSGAVATTVQIGGDFTLVNTEGETVTSADFDGLYRVMFFGFVHCPDFCPTKLYQISQTLDRLPPEVVERIAPIFVTVDPARDTPEVLRDYLNTLDDRFEGLSGTEEQIAATAKAFRVYYQKAPSDDPDFYNVDHSTFTYVMDPQNRFIDVISYDTPIEAMVRKIGGYVESGATG